jgi:hypothetical protein
VSSTLPPEAAGLLALAALCLLPGLLIVRAPWMAVPALSLAFWALSWWWFPFAARSRVLAAALVVFVVLALLRLLPKHTVPPPPDHAGPLPEPPITGPTTGDVPRLRTLPSLVVVGVALALLVPLPFEHHAPGPEMAFHTTSTRLVLWRDGAPATYEPLLPVGPFGAHSPALPTLAGDLAHVAGLDPARAVLLMTLASHGLLVVGLYALLSAVGLRPPAAALAALVGLAVTPWPGVLAMWGAGGPGLALGFGLSAAALVLGHTSRPSAVAAGMLLGAAAMAQPLLALAVGAGLALAVFTGVTRQARLDSVAAGGDAHPPSRAARLRLALTFGVSLGLAGPGLLPLASALSVDEAVAVLGSPRPQEVLDFLAGLVLVSLVALLGRGGRRFRLPRVVAVGLVAAAAVVVFARVHGWLASGQLAPASRSALLCLAEMNRPLKAVCAPESLVDWVPALAGRPAGGAGVGAPRPWVPRALREELAQSPVPPCTKMLDGASQRP